jgi:hypothetical protein
MAEKIVHIVAHSGKKIRLAGRKKRGKCFVDFYHKCCSCGLEHDVMVEHDGKTPQIDITFTRIKAEVEEKKAVKARPARSATIRREK